MGSRGGGGPRGRGGIRCVGGRGGTAAGGRTRRVGYEIGGGWPTSWANLVPGEGRSRNRANLSSRERGCVKDWSTGGEAVLLLR